MSGSDLIAALDDGLAQGASEEIILRRVIGTAPNQVSVDVTCIARVDAASATQIAAGIPATDFNIIMSPTQINQAQWPGGTIPAQPPFNVDQRIPRPMTDKVLMRGEPPRSVVAPVDPKFSADGQLVRINLRITG